MIRDFGDGFETESLSVDDKLGLFSGDIAPDETVVINAPIGSRYFRTNNDIYRKIGTGDTASNWTLDVQGLDGSTAGLLFQVTFMENGTAKNKWLGHASNNNPSNQVPFYIPWDCEMVGLMFSNDEDNVDTDIEIHSVDSGNGSSPSSVKFLWDLDNVRVAKQTFTDTGVTFNEGDKIAVFLKDKGKDPHDPVITIYLRITDGTPSETIENFSGDL